VETDAAGARTPATDVPAADSQGSGAHLLWYGAAWAIVAAGAIAGAIAFVAATGMRPGYDAFGWMVWGHQVLYGSLNTSGAPSWKPLTFLFTLPYALFGQTQVWLWSVTSVTGTIAAGVFAARVAYHLTGPVLPSRRFAPFAAGAFAGVAVMGIQTWPHLVLIANSDPLVVALLLAAIDAHLCGHPRWAFAASVMASLDRPETWAFAGCYGVWLFWTDRRARLAVPLALLAIGAVWFVVPGLTSNSWFSAGDLALNQHTAIHGSKILGVLHRWRNLYELPMQLAFLAGVAVAIWRRDRRLLGVAATALLWVIVEIGFALHGWSAASRYLIEPAAVCIVVAAALVGQLLGGAPWVSELRAPSWMSPALRWGGPVLVVVLGVSLIGSAQLRVHDWRYDLPLARADGRQNRRLVAVVDRLGGGAVIRTCGRIATIPGSQSTLAWAVGLNVGDVANHIGRAIDKGRPVVAFTPHDYGWHVRVYNQPRRQRARCARLKTNTVTGSGTRRSPNRPIMLAGRRRGLVEPAAAQWTTTPARTAARLPATAGPGPTRAPTPGDLSRRSATVAISPPDVRRGPRARAPETNATGHLDLQQKPRFVQFPGNSERTA